MVVGQTAPYGRSNAEWQPHPRALSTELNADGDSIAPYTYHSRICTFLQVEAEAEGSRTRPNTLLRF